MSLGAMLAIETFGVSKSFGIVEQAERRMQLLKPITLQDVCFAGMIVHPAVCASSKRLIVNNKKYKNDAICGRS